MDSRLRQRSITADPNRASSNRMILSDMAPGLLSNRGFHVQATENRTKAGPCPFHRNPQPNLRKKTGVIACCTKLFNNAQILATIIPMQLSV
ncbi:hypothetical protein [Bifidobacterium longum]|uniref:hypothetical protein n=1 Tax=Bifidobacterium longum TaxID=216816 RepID=UPI003877AF4B